MKALWLIAATALGGCVSPTAGMDARTVRDARAYALCEILGTAPTPACRAQKVAFAARFDDDPAGTIEHVWEEARAMCLTLGRGPGTPGYLGCMNTAGGGAISSGMERADRALASAERRELIEAITRPSSTTCNSSKFAGTTTTNCTTE